MRSLSLLAGRTIASLQRDSLHQHLLYLILVWTTIKNNRAFNVKRDVGSYICRFKNKGPLVFHFLFYQMHIIDMRSKSISGVTSTCYNHARHLSGILKMIWRISALWIFCHCSWRVAPSSWRNTSVSLFRVLHVYIHEFPSNHIFNHNLH